MPHFAIHAVFFTTESGRYWETFTKHGFCDWKHALGKDGIITCHDYCKTHRQAMVSWKEYIKNKANHTSIADRMNAARAQLVVEKSTLLENCN